MRLEKKISTERMPKISIHAPIVGCDVADSVQFLDTKKFQSTHPSWGATSELKSVNDDYFISIHAPIVGCDNIGFRLRPDFDNFNPRTHRGVRQRSERLWGSLLRFQSTHPSWGATRRRLNINNRFRDFNPRTHRGVRPQLR